MSLLATPSVSRDGRNRRRARRRRAQVSRVHKPERNNQEVKDDCGSGGDTQGCSVSTDAAEPETYHCEFGLRDVICAGCSGGRLISAPPLCYPLLARVARASGIVRLKVVIDETGKVVWAGVTEGPALLRVAALRAACKRRYEPFVCAGRPVKAFQYISFRFSLQ